MSDRHSRFLAAGASRREFFRSLARYTLLGGLAGLGALLAARGGGRPRRPSDVCAGGGVCRGCPALAGCVLPAALGTKEAATGGHGVRPAERPGGATT